jgi:hypothetical protein
VQKYEKGANRMGSSRLQRAADVLGVAAAFFFEGVGGGPYGSAPSPAYIDDFVGSEEGLRLAKAFMRLRPAVRRRIADLVNEVAGESGNLTDEELEDVEGKNERRAKAVLEARKASEDAKHKVRVIEGDG